MVVTQVKHYQYLKDDKGERLIVLDKTDIEIIDIIKKDPFISDTDIGTLLNLSQPTISARLKHLRKLFIINFSMRYVLINEMENTKSK